MGMRMPEGDDLVRSGVAVAWNDELEDGCGAVVIRRLGDESLRRIAEGLADGDAPLVLEMSDELRKPVETCLCADRERLLADGDAAVNQDPPEEALRVRHQVLEPGVLYGLEGDLGNTGHLAIPRGFQL